MRKILAVILLVLLLPSVGFAGRGYGYGPPPPSYGYDGPRRYPHYDHHSSHYDDRDAWIPLAIVGGVLGIVALSQMDSAYTPPAPPRRICRDTYNYYDENGNFMYSRYVDRPCEN
ncbi:MAG: hypothetical protein AB7U29_18280 [Desulfobulbus sp.]